MTTTHDSDAHEGVSTSRQRLSIPVLIGASVALALAMLGGILLLGRMASSDIMAMAITTVFFGLVAGGLFVVIRRRRELLVPLGATFALIAGGAGIILGAPLVFDDVVDEEVVRVAEQPADADAVSGGDPEPAPEPTGPTQIASGQFEARSHPGTGTATLIDTGEDETVLTLTEFETDNGPDLLVYLVPPEAPAGSVDGFVDLGRLKGNVGDQQYAVPADTGAGEDWRVVVWCRAFAVSFTEATLA